MNATPDSITGVGVTMEAMATRLSRTLGRTVVNKTDLSGAFDLVLRWTPDELNVATDPGAGSIYSAIQEQLGLRLETQKGTIETLVIEGAQKPSGGIDSEKPPGNPGVVDNCQSSGGNS